MSEQEILNAVQDIFRDNFDDDTLEITRSTCADDIEDWDSLEQINLLTAIEKKFNIKFKLADVRGLKDVGDLLDLAVKLDLVQKSGSWFNMGDIRLGQGRDAAKQYFRDHPDEADKLEAAIRRDFHKLMSSQSKIAAKAAGRAVDVSADDFDDDAD